MPVLPEFSLAGKVAVLSTTGGDEAPFLARYLVEAGASVFVIARTPELLEQTLNALEHAPLTPAVPGTTAAGSLFPWQTPAERGGPWKRSTPNSTGWTSS